MFVGYLRNRLTGIHLIGINGCDFVFNAKMVAYKRSNNSALYFLLGATEGPSMHSTHLSASDNASTVSMTMSNPGGNASTDGVLTVTLGNDVVPNVAANDSRSVVEKASCGSASSTRSYSNSTFVKKYVLHLKCP